MTTICDILKLCKQVFLQRCLGVWV